jgi:hypothetical protein
VTLNSKEMSRLRPTLIYTPQPPLYPPRIPSIAPEAFSSLLFIYAVERNPGGLAVYDTYKRGQAVWCPGSACLLLSGEVRCCWSWAGRRRSSST